MERKKRKKRLNMANPTEPIILPASAVVPPVPAADDGIRKLVAGIDTIVFLILVGGICGYLIYTKETPGVPVMAILVMVVQAMIGVITTERNYLFGSSSGSTSKSTTIAQMKAP
jgi:hypothetical protein